MATTVTFRDTQHGTAAEVAAFLAAGLAGATADGPAVELTADALAELAERDAEHDGHYDGRYIWVGGSEYLVRRTGPCEDELPGCLGEGELWDPALLDFPPYVVCASCRSFPMIDR